ncbi:MAG: HlyD family secretion protein [Acetobacteraceae bacterium]|nr:HlyD family secretion protein [Acetobacteraceae bacterium]
MPPQPALAEPLPTQPRRRRPVGLILFLIFLFVLLFHTLLDRLAPYTSEATLQAPVVGVAPNVSGTIVKVSVSDNQPVRTGDPLFQIDTSRFDTAVAQAEANLSNAVMAVGASTAALSAPAARVADAQAALANERAQFLRIQTLAGRGDSPRSQLDAQQARLASAEASLQSAEAGLEEARRRLGPTGADNPQIRAALAQYQRARIDLNDSSVTAPIDGMVTNTVLAPGQYASAGHTVVTIVDTASGWVVANLPENSLGNIRIGDPVLITFNVAPGHLVRGRVASMASGVTQSVAGSLAGPLPYVAQRRQWLREVQRIPVRIELERQVDIPVLRVGSRANVVVLTHDAGVVAAIGHAWLRVVSVADYVF